jgi:hypothetical protein
MVGIDISTPGTTVEDVHLEGYNTGVQIAGHPGQANRINGITVMNVTGGTNGTTGINALVTINNDGNFFGSTEVNILGLSVPPTGSMVTNLLIDNIMGTTIAVSNEKSLAYYVLGRILNAGGSRVRITSSPNGANAPSAIQAIAQTYTITTGQTFTPGLLGCLTGANSVSDCGTSGSANTQFIGVNLTSTGTLAYVQTVGDATVTLDGTVPTIHVGDFICISSVNGKGLDTGTSACSPAGTGIGMAVQGSGTGASSTSVLTHLRSY